MKHCTDCLHYEADPTGNASNARCLRDAITVESPVDGSPIRRSESFPNNQSLFCALERFSSASYACGIEARFFEPKGLTDFDGRALPDGEDAALKRASTPYPDFCRSPDECAGKSNCQKDPTCAD